MSSHERPEYNEFLFENSEKSSSRRYTILSKSSSHNFTAYVKDSSRISWQTSVWNVSRLLSFLDFLTVSSIFWNGHIKLVYFAPEFFLVLFSVVKAAEAYSEPFQTSKMERLMKIVGVQEIISNIICFKETFRILGIAPFSKWDDSSEILYYGKINRSPNTVRLCLSNCETAYVYWNSWVVDKSKNTTSLWYSICACANIE